jgi:hypothetical protein
LAIKSRRESIARSFLDSSVAESDATAPMHDGRLPAREDEDWELLDDTAGKTLGARRRGATSGSGQLRLSRENGVAAPFLRASEAELDDGRCERIRRGHDVRRAAPREPYGAVP